jgi:hypothetical protein
LAVKRYEKMDDRARPLNEKKFRSWESLPDGGRRYSYEVAGHHGWKAKYIKEADSNEITVRFYQEIYNGLGELVEVHRKFPADTGHHPAHGGKNHDHQA